jgi:hypothetical protein
MNTIKQPVTIESMPLFAQVLADGHTKMNRKANALWIARHKLERAGIELTSAQSDVLRDATSAMYDAAAQCNQILQRDFQIKAGGLIGQFEQS